MRTFYTGGCNVILRKSNPKMILEQIQQQSISRIMVVPTTLKDILGLPECADSDFSSLRLVAYGSSAMPPSLLKQVMTTFRVDLEQGYGCTELSDAITMLGRADHARAATDKPELLLSAGKIVPPIEVTIQDEQGQILPADSSGEICVRSPTIMSAYWNNATQSADAFRDGWYLTGDIGFLDSEGYLYISDRKKDMIVSGGENVYPIEVENILLENPSISEVAVVGTPDQRWGETVAAFIVLSSNTEITENEVIQYCRPNLASYKLPRQVHFVEELPRNAMGKVQKHILRKPL